MIGSTRNVKVWAYAAPVDLRKGYNGLYSLVKREMRLDPLSGDCFLFTNRNRNRAKVLMWDGTGLCIYMKRLEKNRFAQLWSVQKDGTVKLTMSELSLFLEGSTLVGTRPLSPRIFQAKPLAL